MKDSTIKILEEKLSSDNISQRSKGSIKLSYIESHHAIREANRAFGFDGWSYEIISLDKVSDEKNTNNNHIIGYTARVRVEAGGVSREDVGFGSGIAKNLADAHEGAVKEAVSDAMKRALRTFGDIFGLALYDKSQEHVEKKAIVKEEPLTIETLITFAYATKTVKSLNKYYKDNEGFIKGLLEDEEFEVVEAFKSHKKELEDKK